MFAGSMGSIKKRKCMLRAFTDREVLRNHMSLMKCKYKVVAYVDKIIHTLALSGTYSCKTVKRSYTRL